MAKEKESTKELEGIITNLKDDIQKKELTISQLNEKLESAQSTAHLAEKQYDGLKENVRRLQDENETLTKRYEEIEGRVLQEQEKFADLVNTMNAENEELVKKIEMLTELNKQEKKRFIWSAKSKSKSQDDDDSDSDDKKTNRKFGSAGIVVPTKILHKIVAHQGQTTSLR